MAGFDDELAEALRADTPDPDDLSSLDRDGDPDS